MLILFAIWFLTIISLMVANIMAGFMPFLTSYQEVEQYYVAYYSAVSAKERGLLNAKYNEVWFVGSGSDDVSSWDVNSKTKTIWRWDTSYLYGSEDSANYNQADLTKVYSIVLENSIVSWWKLNSAGYQVPDKINDSIGDVFGQIDLDKLTKTQNSKLEKNWLTFIVQDGILYFWVSDISLLDSGIKQKIIEFNLWFDKEVWSTVYNIESIWKQGNYQVILDTQKDTSNMKSPDFKKHLFPEL